MATYQFSFYEFQDFTFTGGAGSTTQTQWLTSGTFTLRAPPRRSRSSYDDNEPFFHDGFRTRTHGAPSTPTRPVSGRSL